MSKSNFEKLAKQPMFARPPRADEVVGSWLRRGAGTRRPVGSPHGPHGAICDRGERRIQAVDEDEGGGSLARARRRCSTT